MISKQEQRAESDYLKSVLYVLGKEIEKKESVKDQIEGDIKVAMKYIWEEGSTEADDFINIHESIRQLNRGVLQSDKTLKAYRRMLSSAYFARIDFDDGTEVLPIYLGIASLKDGSEFYVYDWRAPICSPFYDAEIGDASYTLPDGTVVKGKITLKRQYKVEGDKILEIFDTDTQVVDNVLSKLLSTTGSTKMRNIVATIQKEQNKIIRKQDIDILAVQGPAGSGKTSVALHRIAYLLYADKENLNKTNMLILSPNEAFSDYISDVLPQMGEDNVYQTTFYDYVQAYTREFKIKSNMNDIYEELFLNQKTPFYNSIRFKFWPGYIKLLENYLEETKHKLLGIEKDIELDGELMANCEFLARYVENNLSNSTMRIYEQAKLVNEKILSIAGVRLVKNSKGKAKLEKMLKANLKKIRAKSIYSDLYSDLNKFTERVQNIYNELGTTKQDRLSIKDLKEIFDYTQDLLSKNIIPYEDVMAYLYMKERVTGTVAQNGIKQVVIDEAQDYSLVQYKLISNVFKNAQITILGDLNQSIMPFVNYTNYDSILSVLKEDRVHSRVETQYLTKTYRSTVEISTFANKIIGAETTPIKNQLDRHGEEVKVFQDVSSGDKSLIVKHAKELKTEENTVAIIFKTAKECKDFQKSLGRTATARQFTFMVDGNNDFVNNKIMVLPLYMAKGLEFDVVLIPRANEDNFNKKNKKLFYVASTRAMNTLRIYYDEVPSSLIL
ncbi:MAG: AAA family ATPase [Clostridia bacterium]|nr:AAA family ATPase [Clostridia bacterium]